RTEGDAALRALTAELDGCEIADVRVSSDELARALADAPGPLRRALKVAAERIRRYHATQLPGPAPALEADGISLRDVALPVDRAGLYVPGGRAAYPSTVLMTVVPARLAGVAEIALCVPPGPDGRIAAPTLAAAALAGVDEVYRVG